MKKILKNILLIFSICFVILNIIGLVFSKINYNNLLYNEISPILNGEINNETIEQNERLNKQFKYSYGENVPTTVLAYAQGYFIGQANIMEMQIIFLIISLLLGIVLGIIISLSEQSKYKQILIFFIVGIIIALSCTIYIHLTRNLPGANLGEGFVDTLIEECIMPYWIYYILLYIVVFITQYLIGKKHSNDLNKQIKYKVQQHKEN